MRFFIILSAFLMISAGQISITPQTGHCAPDAPATAGADAKSAPGADTDTPGDNTNTTSNTSNSADGANGANANNASTATDDDALSDGNIMEIVVANPKRELYPVAIPSIQPGEQSERATEIAQSVTTTLQNNLEISGYFNVLKDGAFFFDPKKESLNVTDINFQNWFNVGAQGLIKGVVTTKGDKVNLDLRLYRVDRGQRVELAFKGADTALYDVRNQVHRFCNDVMKHFTGEEGIFGTKITFAGKTRDGNSGIYTVDHDGENLTLVSRTNTLNILPAWSPGGDKLVYTSYARNNPDLVLHTIGSKQSKLLSAHEGMNTGGSFSPDGKTLAATISKDGDPEIYLLDPASGKTIKRLTHNPAIDTSPAWSPDGSRIAFVSSRSGTPQIFIMNADGSDPKRVTFRGNYNTTPDWSPKGDKIVFTARDERSQFDIFTADVATNQIERLTQDQGSNDEPSYSPDGRYITFCSTREGGKKLFIMTSDGQHQVKILDKSGISAPSWGTRATFK